MPKKPIQEALRQTLIKRVEKRIDEVEERLGNWREEFEDKLDTLQDYVRRIHRNTNYTKYPQL